MIIGEAGVAIRPDTDGFGPAAEGGILGSTRGIAGKVAGIFAAAFAAVKIGDYIAASVNNASDLEESISKNTVVFGDLSASVEAFAATSATSFGLSRAQALGAAGTYGNLFRSIGLTEDQSASFSTSLVGLSADLASFNNTDTDTALEALRAGLTGETEPLKQFGVNINEALIQQKALELGLYSGEGALTASAKAQASYALIMEQTTLAQGDFARTSDGFANQQRIISAQWAELSTNIGGLFLPAATAGANLISGTLLPNLIRLTDNLGTLPEVFGEAFADGNVGELSGIDRVVGQLGVFAFTAQNAAGVFGDAFTDGVVGPTLAAEDSVAGFAARAGGAAFEIGGVFRTAFGVLATTVGPVLQGVVGQVSGAFSTVRESVAGAFGGGGGAGGFGAIVGVVTSVLQTVVPLIANYITRYAEVFSALIPVVTSLITGLVPVFSQVFAAIGPILSALLPIVSQVAGVITGVLVTALQAILPIIPVLVTAFAEIAGVLAGAFIAVLQQLLPILPTLVGALAAIASIIVSALATALQAILPILPTLVEALAAVAVAITGALLSALNAILPVLPSLIAVLVQLVVSAVVPLLPLLPTLASLIVTVVTALTPLIPVVVQVITLIIQLVVAAITPLLPLLPIIVSLFGTVIGVLSTVISVVVSVVGAFVGFASAVVSTVVGFVSTVVATFSSFSATVGRVFSGIFSTVSSIFNSIFSTVSNIVGRISNAVTTAFSQARDSVVGIFSGIGSAVSGAFGAVGGAIRGVINGAIGIINSGIGFINSNLIAAANAIPFVDIPNIPRIPTLHTGGEYRSPTPGGEGYALLRDREVVLTPEQVAISKSLLRSRDGQALIAGSPTAAGRGEVTINVYGAEGQSVQELAAVVGQRFAFDVSSGVTTRVAVGASA